MADTAVALTSANVQLVSRKVIGRLCKVSVIWFYFFFNFFFRILLKTNFVNLFVNSLPQKVFLHLSKLKAFACNRNVC